MSGRLTIGQAEGASGAQSVDRAARLLALVGQEAEHGIALSRIVEASGLNKPTARRILLALMNARLVEQDAETRRYFLGDEVYALGLLASRRRGVLDLSMESVRTLCARTEDTVFVTIRRDAYSVCLHREEGAHPVRTHALQTGDQHPLGVGAGSLAILAALDDDEVEEIIGRNTPVLAARYPAYSRETLLDGVAEARQGGIAFNPGLVVANSWGIGGAIRFPDGRIAGSLSIAAVDARLQPARRREVGALLKGEIAKVEAKLAKLVAPRASPLIMKVPALPALDQNLREKTHG